MIFGNAQQHKMFRGDVHGEFKNSLFQVVRCRILWKPFGPGVSERNMDEKEQIEVVHGGLLSHPDRIVEEADVLRQQFYNTQGNSGTGEDNGENSPTRRQIRWKAPIQDFFKTNWDIALDIKQRRVGIGVITQDSMGFVVAAMSKSVNTIQDLTTVEAMGALYAVEFCKEIGI
jgi:hypothetical protein